MRHALVGHNIVTAFEKGWSNLSNGDLLRKAEVELDLLGTTDKNLECQQNLGERRIAILVLPPTNGPKFDRINPRLPLP